MTYPTVVQLILKLVLMILVVLVASVPLLVLAGVVLVQNLCPNLRGPQKFPLNPQDKEFIQNKFGLTLSR